MEQLLLCPLYVWEIENLVNIVLSSKTSCLLMDKRIGGESQMARNYWQIAAGSQERDYSEKFLSTGMAFVGGEGHEETMTQVRLGDVVVLKKGRSTIAAVGEVIERDGTFRGNGDKEWLNHFDGWRLPAYCYIAWRVPGKRIKTTGLTRTTIQQLPQQQHRTLADKLLRYPIHPSAGEPSPTVEVSDEQILRHLVAAGLRPVAADELTNTFRRIRLLADYYYTECEWEEVREHETRSFLVLPLLLSLGWAEQKLKVEFPIAGGRIDIAGFTGAFHKKTTSKCSLIVETKPFATGLDVAPKQAERYGRKVDTCQVLVVSNGHCYKAYRRQTSGEFSRTPVAYLDLNRPRDRYPLDPECVGGALQLLECLMPGWQTRERK